LKSSWTSGNAPLLCLPLHNSGALPPIHELFINGLRNHYAFNKTLYHKNRFLPDDVSERDIITLTQLRKLHNIECKDGFGL
jgi:hypothetical protein